MASEPRLVGERCITARDVESVEVCTSGLRLSLLDRLSPDAATCTGRYTLAFALARADLRAALGASAALADVDPNAAAQ